MKLRTSFRFCPPLSLHCCIWKRTIRGNGEKEATHCASPHGESSCPLARDCGSDASGLFGDLRIGDTGKHSYLGTEFFVGASHTADSSPFGSRHRHRWLSRRFDRAGAGDFAASPTAADRSSRISILSVRHGDAGNDSDFSLFHECSCACSKSHGPSGSIYNTRDDGRSGPFPSIIHYSSDGYVPIREWCAFRAINSPCVRYCARRTTASPNNGKLLLGFPHALEFG